MSAPPRNEQEQALGIHAERRTENGDVRHQHGPSLHEGTHQLAVGYGRKRLSDGQELLRGYPRALRGSGPAKADVAAGVQARRFVAHQNRLGKVHGRQVGEIGDEQIHQDLGRARDVQGGADGRGRGLGQPRLASLRVPLGRFRQGFGRLGQHQPPRAGNRFAWSPRPEPDHPEGQTCLPAPLNPSACCHRPPAGRAGEQRQQRSARAAGRTLQQRRGRFGTSEDHALVVQYDRCDVTGGRRG